jgi:nucleoid-associated protein YgaU
VDDHLQAEKSEPESTFYRVREGDTLSMISREFYGDPDKHLLIFEANQPILKDPNRLFPGQTLRIPPLH